LRSLAASKSVNVGERLGFGPKVRKRDRAPRLVPRFLA
jgi:hypothetical protein